MNHDSTSVCGGPIKDPTPHVDRFASQGQFFRHTRVHLLECSGVFMREFSDGDLNL